MKTVFESENKGWDFTVDRHGVDEIVFSSLDDTDPFYMFHIVLGKEEAINLIEYIKGLVE